MPTTFITMSESFKAPPVFSKIVPINAPNIITIPMLVNVPLNPVPIIEGIVFIGIPAKNDRSRETPIIDKNG